MSTPKEELYRMIDALPEKKIIVAKRLLERLLKKQAVEEQLTEPVGNELDTLTEIGTKGDNLLKFVGTIKKDDLELMDSAIKNGCENIDYAEW